LFLDEIGHMPANCQVKLLRAVEERRITPVGSTEPVDIDLRLIAATNKILQHEMKAGRFREDLYYRINVVGIHLPPLRERREDSQNRDILDKRFTWSSPSSSHENL